MSIDRDRDEAENVPVGARCRTLHDVMATVLDYDSGSRRLVLPAGAVFRPWSPEPHWRGVKVPITLGDAHSRFDWGDTSSDGHFMDWSDFFAKCAQE